MCAYHESNFEAASQLPKSCLVNQHHAAKSLGAAGQMHRTATVWLLTAIPSTAAMMGFRTLRSPRQRSSRYRRCRASSAPSPDISLMSAPAFFSPQSRQLAGAMGWCDVMDVGRRPLTAEEGAAAGDDDGSHRLV